METILSIADEFLIKGDIQLLMINVRIKRRAKSKFMYYNYKNYFSIILESRGRC